MTSTPKKNTQTNSKKISQKVSDSAAQSYTSPVYSYTLYSIKLQASMKKFLKLFNQPCSIFALELSSVSQMMFFTLNGDTNLSTPSSSHFHSYLAILVINTSIYLIFAFIILESKKSLSGIFLKFIWS